MDWQELSKRGKLMGTGYSSRITSAEAVQLATVGGDESLETYFCKYLSQFAYALLEPLTLFAVLLRINAPVPIPSWTCQAGQPDKKTCPLKLWTIKTTLLKKPGWPMTRLPTISGLAIQTPRWLRGKWPLKKPASPALSTP